MPRWKRLRPISPPCDRASASRWSKRHCAENVHRGFPLGGGGGQRTRAARERIVEIPDNLEQFESRDPRSTFTAYVPVGSLAKGEAPPYELTSSIVPRGTSFHRLVELAFPSIGFDPARFSCCCRGLFLGPAELSAINPYAVHDHSQPARQGHNRLFYPAAPGNLHRPPLASTISSNAACFELLRRA